MTYLTDRRTKIIYMQIFWLSGGIKIDPENAEEHKALSLLFDSIKLTSLQEITAECRANSKLRKAREARDLQRLSVPAEEVANVTV